MKDIDDLKKIAVLIDADNSQLSKLKSILAEISTHGHIIVKRAYGDWSNPVLKNWKNELNELAIQPIQQFSYTTGKNATDAAMIIDAMDLLYTDKYDAFVLVSSDSDFTMLASRLRTSEMYVFGVGEKKTPQSFRNACDDFIFTEYLGVSMPTELSNPDMAKPKEPKAGTTEAADNGNIEAVITLLDIACDKYPNEEGWVNVSSAGVFIKRSKPDFDSRTFGFLKLPDLIASLSQKYEMKKYKGKGTVNIIAYRKK
jgi:hypothetical protein